MHPPNAPARPSDRSCLRKSAESAFELKRRFRRSSQIQLAALHPVRFAECWSLSSAWLLLLFTHLQREIAGAADEGRGDNAIFAGLRAVEHDSRVEVAAAVIVLSHILSGRIFEAEIGIEAAIGFGHVDLISLAGDHIDGEYLADGRGAHAVLGIVERELALLRGLPIVQCQLASGGSGRALRLHGLKFESLILENKLWLALLRGGLLHGLLERPR